MIVTASQLIACSIAPTQAKAFADPLHAACGRHGIDTPVRLAAFIAQCAHESAGFTALEENLFYRSPERIRAIFPSRVPDLQTAQHLAGNPRALANRVYARRNGNGDEASGDGWAYRGRGLIQLTGRANYRAAGYEDSPADVALPDGACQSAAWFWEAHGCNVLADGSQIDAITKVINGPAMASAVERRERFRTALAALVGAAA